MHSKRQLTSATNANLLRQSPQFDYYHRGSALSNKYDVCPLRCNGVPNLLALAAADPKCCVCQTHHAQKAYAYHYYSL